MSRRPLRRGRGKKKPHVYLPPPTSVVIETLESQGDGCAHLADGKRVYVPGTLPGDNVEVEFTSAKGEGYSARAIGFVGAMPRREPDCSVFLACGGCQLQHLPDPDYLDWKTGVLRTALGRHGLELETQPLLRAPLSSRRRATLKVLKTAAGVIAGFNAPESHQVIAIKDCPRLIDPLNKLFDPVRVLAGQILSKNGAARFVLTALENNLTDIVIESDIDLNLDALEILSDFAHSHQISRITRKTSDNDLEPVIGIKPVTTKIGGVDVPLPPDSFLQPSEEGALLLTELVLAGVGKPDHVIDLYAGVGTFSLPLAAVAKTVLAIDGAPGQIGALQSAINHNTGLAGMTTATRDLQRNPLLSMELNGADAVVFDPPRAGAKEQAQEIAASSVPLVVAVSCNPATLARDLRILVNGGYEVKHVTPVDQFPMSYHVEAVAVLERHE